MTNLCCAATSGHPAFACAADGSSSAAVERAAGWICAGSGHSLLQERIVQHFLCYNRFLSANIEAGKAVESPKSQLPEAANVQATSSHQHAHTDEDSPGLPWLTRLQRLAGIVPAGYTACHMLLIFAGSILVSLLVYCGAAANLQMQMCYIIGRSYAMAE